MGGEQEVGVMRGGKMVVERMRKQGRDVVGVRQELEVEL
jgi:hypothetical protein